MFFYILYIDRTFGVYHEGIMSAQNKDTPILLTSSHGNFTNAISNNNNYMYIHI